MVQGHSKGDADARTPRKKLTLKKTTIRDVAVKKSADRVKGGGVSAPRSTSRSA